MSTKLADDGYMIRDMRADPRMLSAQSWSDLSRYKQRLQAAALTNQLREIEAQRMSQTVENFGGPGTGRSRYNRMLMNNPYRLSPLLPVMGGGGLGPMRAPPGTGEYRVTETDAGAMGSLSALDQGITHTASVLDIYKTAGSLLAKEGADGYYNYDPQRLDPMPNQSTDRGPPAGYSVSSEGPQLDSPGRPGFEGHAQQAGRNAASSVYHLSKGVGAAGKSIGHGAAALGGAVGKGLSLAGRGFRDFMTNEAASHQRWGSGTPPAAMTNEYGQPIFG